MATLLSAEVLVRLLNEKPVAVRRPDAGTLNEERSTSGLLKHDEQSSSQRLHCGDVRGPEYHNVLVGRRKLPVCVTLARL